MTFSCRGVWFPCPPSNIGISLCSSLMFFIYWTGTGLVLQSSLNDVLVQPPHHAQLPYFKVLDAWCEGGTFHSTSCINKLSLSILFDIFFLYLLCCMYVPISLLITSNNFFSVMLISCRIFCLCAIYMVAISFSVGAGKGIASPVVFHGVIFVVVGQGYSRLCCCKYPVKNQP